MGDGFANGVIRLENEPRAVFYAGQEISGSVLFELNQPLSFSVLTLTFLGEANVLWTEDQKEEYNGVVRHRLVKYIGNEEYFKHTEFLAGGQVAIAGLSKLPAGSRAFPFRYRIPLSAPSSFMGEKGSVSYSIIACLVSADPMAINEELVKEFKVIAPLDLNFGPPDVKNPIELEFEEVYGCDCICTPDPMTIRVNLPATGYCPGQVIPVAVHIDNQSSTEIKKMYFQLLSKERYRSKQPIAEYIPAEKVLTSYKSGAILGRSKKKFTCDMTVPDMVPPYLENCSIIDMAYYFRIRIKMTGCNSDLKTESRIYLGLVPLFDSTETNYVHPMAHSLPIVALTDLNKEYEPTEAVNPAFVEPTNTNNKMELHPPQNTPYPSKNSPNPSKNSPNPSNNSPYPCKIVAFPPKKSPYSSKNTPLKPKNSPYPSENTPFPSQMSPYPTQNPPYPSPKAPYPSVNTAFQSKNSPYPSENTPVPSQKTPYPSPNPPYPSENTPLKSKNSPHRSPKAPYPPENTALQSNNSPYPPGNTPLQSKNSPHRSPKAPYPPENTALQSKNSPYPPGNTPPQSKNSAYTSPKAPSPSENTPFPSQMSPYPSQNSPYPVAVNSPHSINKPFTDIRSYPSENDQCPAENPSYTSKSPPYPVENKTDSLTTGAMPNPLGSYEIGFRTESVSPRPGYPIEPVVSPPYPLVNTMPGNSPPYPVSNTMPGPHLPAVERDLRIYLPPVSPRVEPSAPPSSS